MNKHVRSFVYPIALLTIIGMGPAAAASAAYASITYPFNGLCGRKMNGQIMAGDGKA